MIPQLDQYCGRMDVSLREDSWERRLILLRAGCYSSCRPAGVENLGKSCNVDPSPIAPGLD